MTMRTNYGALPIVLTARGRAKPVSNRPRDPSVGFGPHYRSKLEKAYADYLEMLRRIGEIAGWWYEPLSLRLPGRRNRYKPDFLVQALSSGLEFHEVKGWNRSNERALIKIKVAAGCHQWARFVQITRHGHEWDSRFILP